MSWSSVFGSSSKIKLPGDITLAAKPDGSVKVSGKDWSLERDKDGHFSGKANGVKISSEGGSISLGGVTLSQHGETTSLKYGIKCFNIKADVSPLQHPGKTYLDSTGVHFKADISAKGEASVTDLLADHGFDTKTLEKFGINVKVGFSKTITLVDKDISSSLFFQEVIPNALLNFARKLNIDNNEYLQKELYFNDHGKYPEDEDSNSPLGLNNNSAKKNHSEFIDVKDDSAAVAAINRLNPFAPTAAYANELPPAENSGNADYSGSPAAGFVALAEAGGAASAFLSAVLPAAALYGREAAAKLLDALVDAAGSPGVIALTDQSKIPVLSDQSKFPAEGEGPGPEGLDPGDYMADLEQLRAYLFGIDYARFVGEF